MPRVNTVGADHNNGEKTVQQLVLEKIKEVMEPESTMTEEDSTAYDNKINQKIKAGGKLTQSEMNYIRKKDPIMYAHVLRVQMQREMLEKKLKHCKSKKEVEEAYSQAIAGISKKDPDKQALISAYFDVTVEFKKTSKYKSLPDEVKKEEKKEKERERQIEDMIDMVDQKDIEISSFDVKA